MHKKAMVAAIMALVLFAAPAYALGETNDAGSSGSFDATDLIAIGTSILALVLGIISFIGYRRDGRAKFLFVSAAFFIVVLKGVLSIGSDVIALQKPTLDIIASLLDFIVLLCFFTGMMKR